MQIKERALLLAPAHAELRLPWKKRLAEPFFREYLQCGVG